MNAGPLLCARCSQPIRPGDAVEFIGPDVDQLRIFTEDDALIVHAECPT